MIRVLLLLGVLSVVPLFSLPVIAQETPKVELFGGYSYAGSGSHGFDVSVAGNVNEWFGLVADVGGQYTRLTDQGFTEKIRTHSLLFGPRFSVRRSRAVPFAHALFGVSHLKTETDEFGPPLTFKDNSFAMALGGGLDVKVNNRVAIRVFQVDYFRTNFFGTTQNKGRISAGIVLRFGQR